MEIMKGPSAPPAMPQRRDATAAGDGTRMMSGK